MRIFVAGATGGIGRRLVPMLIEHGHLVTGTTRSHRKLDIIKAMGADGAVVDGLDSVDVIRAVQQARPEAIVHQMTALASMRNLRRFDEEFAVTNQLRAEGTSNLIDAARVAGVPIFVAQSYTGWPNERLGGRVKTEDDPLDAQPPVSMTQTLNAIRALEQMVRAATDLTGIVLRYGSLYGPGTSIAPGGDIVEMLRKRQFPIVGGGAGVWSFIHVDDAARATRLAIERGHRGVFNIVDDEPAEVSEWLPVLASAVGAKLPLRIPAWIARFGIGSAGVSMMTRIRGSSNEKAKRELGWTLEYPTWRIGFRDL